jgi:hypothetical protein
MAPMLLDRHGVIARDELPRFCSVAKTPTPEDKQGGTSEVRDGEREMTDDEDENDELPPTLAQLEAWLAESQKAQRILSELQIKQRPSEERLPSWRQEVLLEMWAMGWL